jgi:AcrR family transcriptional regulator
MDRIKKRTADETRRAILEAAYELFYRHGFARVRLDAIAARAGVTKRTLYYHFRSKDDLLAAALASHSELALARIPRWGAGLATDLEGAIEVLFARLGEWAGGPRFKGAGYTRLAMELADLPGHPARAIARRHKSELEAWLAGELARRGAADPAEAARQVTILLEGAVAMMVIHRDAGYIHSAAEAAKRLVRAVAEASSSAAPASPAYAAAAR